MDKPILISLFKTEMPSILGGLSEGKYFTTPLAKIWTPEMCKYPYGVSEVYPGPLIHSSAKV